jgi:hypothetical protein
MLRAFSIYEVFELVNIIYTVGFLECWGIISWKLP